jgi:hypothetical protein|tara:strand:- start:74 stop:517 length:444 start_codon:yes stop_codon:yes gene_type:complete
MERSNTQPDEEQKTIRAGSIDVNGYINSLKRDIEIKDNIIQRLRDYIEELKEAWLDEDEDDDDDDDKEEKEDEQYNKFCDNECGTKLTIITPIMCYSNKEKGDKTLCNTCYWDAGYCDDDENEDNKDEEEEETGEIIVYKKNDKLNI